MRLVPPILIPGTSGPARARGPVAAPRRLLRPGRTAAAVLLGLALAMAGRAATPAVSGAGLPWKSALVLPWQIGAPDAAPPPDTTPPTPSYLPLKVRNAPGGALRITDDQGNIRLRTGLPGRPLKAWRDWGTPVPDLFQPLAFSPHTPFQRGIGGVSVDLPDFRAALEGLLWILDDDEHLLTVVHPATSQVVYLLMPGGQGLDLGFYPDHLEVKATPEGAAPRQDASAWSLSWLALLPQFVQLGKDPTLDRPRGTALLPFPKE